MRDGNDDGESANNVGAAPGATNKGATFNDGADDDARGDAADGVPRFLRAFFKVREFDLVTVFVDGVMSTASSKLTSASSSSLSTIKSETVVLFLLFSPQS